MTKALKIFLALLGLYVAVSMISNIFDNDFGWHLRFGQQALTGQFQYTDGYTWTFLGQEWINHEWGGDMLFWLIYDNLGYFALVILTSACLWLAFLLAPRIFFKKITLPSITISLLLLISIKFIAMMRLSMLSSIFFIAIWWSLENINRKKIIWIWPPLLWLWSALHGSWILGFIIINIYIWGNVLCKLLSMYFARTKIKALGNSEWLASFKNWLEQNIWSWKTIIRTMGWQILSACAIIINPYGIKIWTEILSYFSNSYYKSYINEWLPTYAFPIHSQMLVIAGVAITIVIIGLKTKKISPVQTLLFIALFLSASQYRRNCMFFVLACAPVLLAGWNHISSELQKIFLLEDDLAVKKRSLIKPSAMLRASGYFILIAIVITVMIASSPIRYSNDGWSDSELLLKNNFPASAVEYLKYDSNDKIVRIFNDYGWGGYMIWELPNGLLHIDGRSPATWKIEGNKFLLKHHIDILTNLNQLIKLEKSNVDYVILANRTSEYSLPNWFNKMIFTSKRLDKLFDGFSTPLITELNQSANWQIIYQDNIAIVWKRLPSG
ncbi:MAG: hypothetical protein ABH832_01970 [bacterium]